MARRSQILKLSTVLVFICLFLIMLLNIFNNGQSYHYMNVENQQEMAEKQRQILHQQHFEEVKKLLPNRTDLKLDYGASEPLTFELITEMENKLPSLPFEYFYHHSNRVMQKFKNCAQYPAIQVLNFFNTYWQTFYLDNSVYQLYGAYYDDRPTTGPVIRILSMSNHQNQEFPILYCQLWYQDDNHPVLTTVKEFKIIWDMKWGKQPQVYYPYLMTCEIPKNTNITGDPIPKVVNLVKHQCDTGKNSLRIIYNKPKPLKKKHKFAVCVKGLDFLYEDLSVRLIEWLELLRLLGVEKVFMHNLQVHDNISKVLNYYQNKEFVEVQDFTLVGGVVGQPKLEHWLIKGYKLNKRLNELVSYNDCFYRNMYKYDYIALLDIDEIIIPKGDLTSWQNLVEKSQVLEKQTNCRFAALCAANVYFPLKLPDQQVPKGEYPLYMNMLNHVYRIRDYATERYHVKCLHNTQHVLTLHNHYPLSHLNTSCDSLDLPTTYAQLQHYRDLSLDVSKKEVDIKNHKIIKEDNLDRFREPLIERCAIVLRELGFIK